MDARGLHRRAGLAGGVRSLVGAAGGTRGAELRSSLPYLRPADAACFAPAPLGSVVAILRDERERCRKRVICQSEALAAHNRALMGQVEELLTRYGRIDLFWFDGKPGGRLYEDAGDGNGLVWYHVIALDAPTRDGLKKYQEAEGIKVTGTLNRATLEKMSITLTEKQRAM